MTDTAEPERFDLRSHTIADDKRQELIRLFPEIRTEDGQIDFDRLKLVLGESLDVGRERYGLNWPGKSECFRTIQAPSLGTLRPAQEASVEWDTSQNLIIEGDNLEVLKLLQKSYLGKVKLIYIDPPYNTGNDFIYPDNFAESLQTYLEYTGQADPTGRKFGTNPETDGRFHSRWLSMMYPRLYLARNLLRDDGAIFISCDDNEVHTLRLLMNEVFGEENFIATVIWQKVFSPKNTAKHFSEDHDYVVVYARTGETWRPRLLPRTEEMEARYDNPDNDPRGPWTSGDFAARNFYSQGTYKITCPSGRVIAGPPAGSYWRMSEDKFLAADRDGRIWWGKDGNGAPRLKRFLSEVKQGRVPQTLWGYADVGHTQDAKKELLEFVPFEETDNVLDSVKPSALIRRMLQLATKPDEEAVVLDFFGGSGSTGHAVLAQNAEDRGNRRFVLVQLPEPLPKAESSLRTIADITKERVRRVIARLNDEDVGKLDLESGQRHLRGFRVFKLAESNFVPWEADRPKEASGLSEQLDLHVHHIRQGRTDPDLLYEILIKDGFPPGTPVEEITLAGKRVYSAAAGSFLISLERELTLELIRALAERRPERVVLLDQGFAGTDQLKANAVKLFESRGIVRFRTV